MASIAKSAEEEEDTIEAEVVCDEIEIEEPKPVHCRVASKCMCTEVTPLVHNNIINYDIIDLIIVDTM